MAQNSSEVEVTVEKSQSVTEKFEVKWKLVSESDGLQLSNGSVIFNHENDQKTINLDLQNATKYQKLKFELFWGGEIIT